MKEKFRKITNIDYTTLEKDLQDIIISSAEKFSKLRLECAKNYCLKLKPTFEQALNEFTTEERVDAILETEKYRAENREIYEENALQDFKECVDITETGDFKQFIFLINSISESAYLCENYFAETMALVENKEKVKFDTELLQAMLQLEELHYALAEKIEVCIEAADREDKIKFNELAGFCKRMDHFYKKGNGKEFTGTKLNIGKNDIDLEK